MTQPEPPTEQQLDNITAKVAELRERLDRKNPWPSDNESYFVAEGWANGTRNALDKLDPAGLVAEIRRLTAELAKSESIRGNADFHLGQEMARRQLAEKETARLRAESAAVAAFLDEQELAARAFELPTPAWVEAVRAASGAPVAPLAVSQPSEAPVEPNTATRPPTGRTGDPRRTLTPTEYDAAWHAVEGAAGDEGADPGTVLHAVLDRLGIDWQDAASTV